MYLGIPWDIPAVPLLALSPNPSPDQGLVGYSMGSQGTCMYHGTMGWDGQKGPSMYPRPGTGGMSHGIPGTMGQWHVPKSQWTFYGNAGQLWQTQQVRYMIMSLREAWNKFKEQHSTPKMCLSKFCELQPPNIKLFDQLPHQVCLCSYHENVRLLLVGLGEHTSLSTEFSSFVEQVTCDF